MNNWLEYLTDKLDFTSVWTVIKKATIISKPIGGNVFLHFLKSCLPPSQYDSIKMYRIPVERD